VLNSPHFVEVGLGVVATNYSGDLAEPHISIPQTS
jgi:hypothetical protein